jgi:CubicO group peptidase (beta-lactamase class C family)
MRFNVRAVAVALAALLAGPAIAQDPPEGAPVNTTPAAPSSAAPSAPAPAPYAPLPKAAPKAAPKSAPRPAVAAPRPATTGTPPAAAMAPAPGGGLAAYVPPSLAAPTGARLAPNQPLPAAELEAFVDGVVREAMAREGIAGVTVSVVQSGRVVLKKGYGYASLSPAKRVDPDRTLFRLGSASKAFTWIALLKEIEEGRIRANSPINLYLPERLQVRDQGYGTPIRVANLLDHTAGFEERTFGHLYERRPQRVRPLADYLRQERPRRVHAPGAVSSVSTYGAALAGEAVSYVAQRPFERLIEEEILVPARLTRTTFREPRPAREGLPIPMGAGLAADVATGYHATPWGLKAQPFEYASQIAPAASASSTAADMARFLALILGNGSLEGVTIYGPRTAQALRTPMLATAPGVNGWAGGLMVYDLPGGLRGYGHQGSTLAFQSNLVAAPALGLGVFVAANTDTGRSLAERLPSQIIREFYVPPMPFPRPGNPELVDLGDRYEGFYVTTQRAYGGLEAFASRLRNGVWVKVLGDGRLATATGDRTALWAPDGDPSQGRFVGLDGTGRLAFDVRQVAAASFVDDANLGRHERTDSWLQPRMLLNMAVLTVLAALGTLAGLLSRDRREFRETSIQSRMSQLQNAQAVLWLAVLGLFAVWFMRSRDPADLMYGWPGPFLILASACALVAAAMTVLTFVFLPAIWQGGRRVDSWSALRKFGFTLTVLIYAAFSAALFNWGALSPWSG